MKILSRKRVNASNMNESSFILIPTDLCEHTATLRCNAYEADSGNSLNVCVCLATRQVPLN